MPAGAGITLRFSLLSFLFSTPNIPMDILRSLLIGSLLFFFFFSGTSMAFARQDTAFSQKPFTDVSVSSSQYQAIEYLRTQNVIKGFLDGTFRPDTSINRAEFVEFIINPFILDTNDMGQCVSTHVSDLAKNVFFSDVSRDAWFAENVCFAKTKNIVDGYPNGTFRPGNSISFVEAAKIISNVFSMNIDNYQTGEFWYRPYVQRLSDLHAIPVSIQRISETITRGEMAQIVYRLKVDATQMTSMRFDAGSNTLSPQAPLVPVVIAPPPPPVVAVDYSRPSRRLIIAEAERLNALRASQR